MRFADTKVVCQCDGRPWYLNDRIPSDGRWRIILFPGDFKTNASLNKQMLDVGAYLESSDSFIKRYTPSTEKIDAIIEVLLVHASSTDVVEWDDFPHAFRPRYQDRRMDYWKIYADSESLHESSGQAYEKYGIDRNVGALLVLRPDGYVASVTAPNMEGVSQVAAFFDRFLIPL
jgi:phenol 2-monooxygenase